MRLQSWTVCDACLSRDDVRYVGDTTLLLCAACRTKPPEDLWT